MRAASDSLRKTHRRDFSIARTVRVRPGPRVARDARSEDRPPSRHRARNRSALTAMIVHRKDALTNPSGIVLAADMPRLSGSGSRAQCL